MTDKKYSDQQLKELIDKYCNNFTELAAAGRYDPIHGREEEVSQVILILLQKGRKNAMISAPAGVGKTALCVALAQQIADGKVPKFLKGAQLLEVDLAAMAAGTSTTSEFQGRIVPLLKAIGERYFDDDYPKYILFIDEIHQIMPTCEGSSYAGLSEVMKPYLTAGSLNMIGATTKDEYRIYVAVDPAMDRRFQKVNLSIPDHESTVKILQALRPRYEDYHKIKIPDEALPKIVSLTDEHLRTLNQPDKSITTMDAACAYSVMYYSDQDILVDEAINQVMAKRTGLHAKIFNTPQK